MLGLLAAFTTLTAVAMSATAAWDRGGTVLDRALLVAMAVTICAGAHLLLALSRRRVTWLLWSACLLGTIYGHLTFFTHAALRAGTVRAQQSAQVADVARQIDVAREALASIKARPVAIVAVELSRTKSERRRQALEAELTEAKRAARLLDGVVDTTAVVGATRTVERADPVMSRLAVVTGSSEASIGLAVGIAFAVLLELTGAFLWVEALKPRSPLEPDHTEATKHDPLDALRDAVGAGLCKPTVAGIRVFLGCGQARAIEMRRALKGST